MITQVIQQELTLLTKQQVSFKDQQNLEDSKIQKNVSKQQSENRNQQKNSIPLGYRQYQSAKDFVKEDNLVNLLATQEDDFENCRLKKEEKKSSYSPGSSDDEPPQKLQRDEVNKKSDEYSQKTENWLRDQMNKSIQLQDISHRKDDQGKLDEREEEKNDYQSQESIQNMYFKTQNSEIEKIGFKSQSQKIYEFIIEINLSDYLSQSQLTLSELNQIYNDFLSVKQNDDKATSCKLMIILIELYYKSYRVKKVLCRHGVSEFVMAGYNIKTKAEIAIFVQLPQFNAQKGNCFEKFKQEQELVLQKIISEQFKLDQINHNYYILKVYEQFLIEPVLGLVQITEIFECDLEQEIQMQQKDFTNQKLINIFFQLINALTEIHSNDITHLQLNPRNILKIQNGQYKLSNFGRFSINQSNQKVSSDEIKFYSPEQMECIKNSSSTLKMQDKCDIYSMGLTLLTLFNLPQEKLSLSGIREGKFLEEKIDDPVQLSLMIFIKYYMICKDPKNRFNSLKLRAILLSEFSKQQINREQEYLRIVKLISSYKAQNLHTHKYLSYLYFLTGQLNKNPGNNLIQSIKIAQQNTNFNNSDLLQIQNMYALILSSEHRFKESSKILNNCLSQRKQLYKDQLHYDIPDCVNSFAISFTTQEEYKMALEQDLKTLELRESLYNTEHPEIIRSYLNIASTYEKLLGNKKFALDFYLKALKIREDLFSGNHPDLVESYNSLATFFQEDGDNIKQQEYEQKLNSLKNLEQELFYFYIQNLKQYAFQQNILIKQQSEVQETNAINQPAQMQAVAQHLVTSDEHVLDQEVHILENCRECQKFLRDCAACKQDPTLDELLKKYRTLGVSDDFLKNLSPSQSPEVKTNKGNYNNYSQQNQQNQQNKNYSPKRQSIEKRGEYRRSSKPRKSSRYLTFICICIQLTLIIQKRSNSQDYRGSSRGTKNYQYPIRNNNANNNNSNNNNSNNNGNNINNQYSQNSSQRPLKNDRRSPEQHRGGSYQPYYHNNQQQNNNQQNNSLRQFNNYNNQNYSYNNANANSLREQRDYRDKSHSYNRKKSQSPKRRSEEANQYKDYSKGQKQNRERGSSRDRREKEKDIYPEKNQKKFGSKKPMHSNSRSRTRTNSRGNSLKKSEYKRSNSRNRDRQQKDSKRYSNYNAKSRESQRERDRSHDSRQKSQERTSEELQKQIMKQFSNAK
ncbi:hypothetical protein ABPG73_012166 [Tetrahymena malaccensis]